MTDLQSDRIERTTSFREDELGPAMCALANNFPNHRKPGYILLGVEDNGIVGGITITDEHLQKIGNVKPNGNVLPQPSLVVSQVFSLDVGIWWQLEQIHSNKKVLQITRTGHCGN